MYFRKEFELQMVDLKEEAEYLKNQEQINLMIFEDLFG
jgi:hypothetical protein